MYEDANRFGVTETATTFGFDQLLPTLGVAMIRWRRPSELLLISHATTSNKLRSVQPPHTIRRDIKSVITNMQRLHALP